ncbi:anchored repeat-type ABC transporter ATP-binding subunit [Corynebacterium tapiri]|uniref:Anchored repeat-type ABC transporter ATP-binding subunit n=1 Tax=Corynebacterium tapiri TaxID=1448266 RepID=A0A5C4U3S9_9CORY|nr:anchored repeat-type ABC transporter ATP-binding subunit [Corynebacterium tapiri]TNL95704.1 anchored repeat-type ABC transporter ATP-binding subunit [Corynebacterium tapiri]
MANLHAHLESVTLSGRRVLHDIDLDLAQGTFAGLLGPNGAGKTTLLRSILGLIPVTGEVRLGEATGRGLRKATGYVPQRHQVAWDFPISVERCVLHGRTDLHGWFSRFGAEDFHAGDEAIELADLQDLRTRPIAELSGGQRQRVLVARALARQPRLLILDEPFTGVDVPTAENLLRLFRQLANSGVTVLMSSHNLGETVDTVDEVLLLNRTLITGDLRTTEPWIRAFGVNEHSPLLRTVGVA